MEKTWNKLKEGLRTYCNENGFRNVILGLSGGMDSALVAVLAADALGGENEIGRASCRERVFCTV